MFDKIEIERAQNGWLVYAHPNGADIDEDGLIDAHIYVYNDARDVISAVQRFIGVKLEVVK